MACEVWFAAIALENRMKAWLRKQEPISKQVG